MVRPDVILTRGELAARVCAAIFGIYLALWLLMYALAALLPLARPEAVIITSLLACLLYPAALLWALTVGRAKAWRGMALMLALGAVCMAGVWTIR